MIRTFATKPTSVGFFMPRIANPKSVVPLVDIEHVNGAAKGHQACR